MALAIFFRHYPQLRCSVLEPLQRPLVLKHLELHLQPFLLVFFVVFQAELRQPGIVGIERAFRFVGRLASGDHFWDTSPWHQQQHVAVVVAMTAAVAVPPRLAAQAPPVVLPA